MNVLNLEHISKTYGEKVIFDDISCGIHQGDKIGIIGIRKDHVSSNTGRFRGNR